MQNITVYLEFREKYKSSNIHPCWCFCYSCLFL